MPTRSSPTDAIWDETFAITPDDAAQIRECVRYAVLAPSGHNTQPWSFVVHDGTVEIRADRTRSMPVGDPDDRELTISLGCALENLLIAARQVGFDADVEPAPGGVRARLRRARPQPSALFDAIPKRHTNRRPYDGTPIPADDLQALAALTGDGVHADFFTTREDIETVVGLVEAGNAIQLNDAAFMDELIGWIRFSRRSIETRRDGLSSRAVGRPPLPDWVGRQVMRRYFTPTRQTKLDVKLVRSASAVMVISSDRNDERAWIDVGRAFERILLTLANLGIRSAHLNQNWQRPELERRLHDAFALGGRHPQLAVRLGYAAPLPHAPRRPVEAVLTTNGHREI